MSAPTSWVRVSGVIGPLVLGQTDQTGPALAFSHQFGPITLVGSVPRTNAPAAQSATFSLAEDTTLIETLHATDADGDALVYSILSFGRVTEFEI